MVAGGGEMLSRKRFKSLQDQSDSAVGFANPVREIEVKSRAVG